MGTPTAQPPTPAGPLAAGVRTGGRNLPVAIASGVLLAVLFVGTLFVHPYAFLGFLFLLVVGAVGELHQAVGMRGLRPATPVIIGAGAVALFGAYTTGPSAQSLGLALLLLGGAAWVLVDGERRNVVGSLAATCLIGLWVPLLASFAGLLLARPDGRWLVLATVALTAGSDIAAYAVGSRLGSHRLAPSVSPAKTWEGFAGAIVVALVIAGAGAWALADYGIVDGLALGLGVGLAATLGDLAESMVKRDLGVKDLGGILPGHGGIMERADAVIFALPVAHLVLVALGR